MAEKGSRAATVDFVAEHMKKKPDISMSELKALGAKEGHNVYPLIMGLALKQLGKSRTGGDGKKSGRGPGRPRKTAEGAKRGPGRPPGSGRGPGRPPGSGRKPGRPPGSGRGPGRPKGSGRGPGRPAREGGGIQGTIGGLLEHVRQLQREADSLRKALSQIREVAANA